MQVLLRCSTSVGGRILARKRQGNDRLNRSGTGKDKTPASDPTETPDSSSAKSTSVEGPQKEPDTPETDALPGASDAPDTGSAATESAPDPWSARKDAVPEDARDTGRDDIQSADADAPKDDADARKDTENPADPVSDTETDAAKLTDAPDAEISDSAASPEVAAQPEAMSQDRSDKTDISAPEPSSETQMAPHDPAPEAGSAAGLVAAEQTDAEAKPDETDQPAAQDTDQATPEGVASNQSAAAAVMAPVGAATAASVAPSAPPAQKTRFFPLLLGGLIAGGIGYGTHFYLMQDDQNASAEIAALQAQVADLRSALGNLPPAPDLGGLEAELGELRDTVAALDVRDQIAAAMEELRTEFATGEDIGDSTQIRAVISQVARELTQTRERLDRLDRDQADRDARLDAVESGRAELDALRADMDALPSALDALRADMDVLPSALDGLRAEIADLRALSEERVVQAEATVDATLARAGLEMMRAALESGTPYSEALVLLQDAGVEVPSALVAPAARGLQTVEMLQDSFPDLARTALRATYQDDATSGAAARVENFLRAQLGIRSTAPRDGDDPDAVLSRASALVAQGDIEPALAELEALPDAGQAVLAQWRDAAQARIAAHAAFAEFSMTVSNQ